MNIHASIRLCMCSAPVNRNYIEKKRKKKAEGLFFPPVTSSPCSSGLSLQPSCPVHSADEKGEGRSLSNWEKERERERDCATPWIRGGSCSLLVLLRLQDLYLSLEHFYFTLLFVFSCCFHFLFSFIVVLIILCVASLTHINTHTNAKRQLRNHIEYPGLRAPYASSFFRAHRHATEITHTNTHALFKKKLPSPHLSLCVLIYLYVYAASSRGREVKKHHLSSIFF